jgi:hypothetical protein
MKSIIGLYIKLFFYLGLPFGIILQLFDWFDGSGYIENNFVRNTTYFGGTMSLLLGTSQIIKLKMLGVKNFSADKLSVIQNRELESKLKPHEVESAISNDPYLSKMKLTKAEDSIILNTKTGLRSWGEKITITPGSTNKSVTAYKVESRPKLASTLVDLGKNYENVMRIERLLEVK